MQKIVSDNKVEFILPHRKKYFQPLFFSSIFGISALFAVYQVIDFVLSGNYFDCILMIMILFALIGSIHFSWFITAQETVILDKKRITIKYNFLGFNHKKIVEIKSIKKVELIDLNDTFFGNTFEGFSDYKIRIKNKWLHKTEIGKYIDFMEAQLLIYEINKQRTHNTR